MSRSTGNLRMNPTDIRTTRRAPAKRASGGVQRGCQRHGGRSRPEKGVAQARASRRSDSSHRRASRKRRSRSYRARTRGGLQQVDPGAQALISSSGSARALARCVTEPSRPVPSGRRGPRAIKSRADHARARIPFPTGGNGYSYSQGAEYTKL